MRIHFILVEPAIPGNIGASARAIKTMGFRDLRLVNPACDHLQESARWLAYGSNDILEQAAVFKTLQDAVNDIDFVVGTTAKPRTVRYEYHASDELCSILAGKQDTVQNVALVFGREDKGLTNQEIGFCHLLSTVPMKAKYPSLNLSQAVMIFAYVLSPLVLQAKKRPEKRVKEGEFLTLCDRMALLLRKAGIREDSNVYGRIMERLPLLSGDDIRLFHSVLSGLIGKGEIGKGVPLN